ncbi:hypothetical protein DER44DRAFT_815007 [Fusarium oxysporum]|nr:hypothetical protein DER44DRAFT_815007 [Fusarium oxysporum]
MSGPKIMPGAQKELDHFFDIPWCRDQFLHPDAVAVPRLDDKQDGRGSTGKLFSETLNSPSTIYHRIVLYRDPSSATSLKPKLRNKWLPIETCSVFYALGDGVCGFGDICHGGVQATLLDEKMVARDKSWDARPVQYLRPLRVPKVIQVTSSMGEISDDGTSFLVQAVIKDEDVVPISRND